MSNERDVERIVNKEQLADTLERIAKELREDSSFRIQVKNKRFTVPKDAECSIEHEVENNTHELELQFKWNSK